MSTDPVAGRLFLLDGSSLAFRAYFALPETIATREGFPTNALYGFSQMLLKLVTEYRPAAIVVAWDAREKTFRHEEFEQYKAHRPQMPEPLSQQWEHLPGLVEAFGAVNLVQAGYEADDILGTLVMRARRQKLGTVVVTGDRDALQLVDDEVAVMTTGRGITDVKVYTPAAVVERYGVAPAAIPDFIGLKGDSSDNIPGVRGIGEKTAAQLLQEFGSIEAIYERLDEIRSEKRRALLAEHEADARLSKRLATMVPDVPVECDPGALVHEGPYVLPCARLEELFRRWEFTSLVRRVRALAGDEPGGGPPDVVCAAGPQDAGGEGPSAAAETVSAGAQLQAEFDLGLTRAAATAAPPPACRFEDGCGALAALLEQRECGFGVAAIADDDGTSAAGAATCGEPEQDGGEDARAAEPAPPRGGRYAVAVDDGGPHVPVALVGEAALGSLWRAAAHVIGHDVKGMPGFVAAPFGPAADTLVGAYLLAPERPESDLRILADVGPDWCVAAPPSLPAAVAAAASAAATRAVLARRLAAEQAPRLEELRLGRLYREVELPLIRVLAHMERAGIRLDQYRLGEITARLREQVDELADRIHELAGGPFTIGSTKQLAEVLFSRLGLEPLRKGKTGFSTDARTLASLREAHPIVAAVEEWRELTKLLNTYLDKLPACVDPGDERLHTTFNQAITATGRLSSTDPNLQNIPTRTALGAEIRSCFVAEDGCRLVVADYSQIELRLMASFAEEPALLDAFRRGEDVHRATAAAVAGIEPEDVSDEQRARAKATNFGIMYGLSAFGLSQQVGMSVEEARDFIAAYFDRYPHVRAFRDRVIVEAAERGYVSTVLGRRRAIPELRSGVQHVRALGERLAVNTILQGSAADIMKLAMLAAHAQLERRRLHARLLLQVHDELVFEAPDDEVEAVEELACSTMTGAWRLDPPLEVHVGSGANWRDAK